MSRHALVYESSEWDVVASIERWIERALGKNAFIHKRKSDREARTYQFRHGMKIRDPTSGDEQHWAICYTLERLIPNEFDRLR